MIPTLFLALAAVLAQPAWADRPDSGAGARSAARAPTEADYPPWIVRQEGGHAYKPQYMPAPLAGTTRCQNAELARSLAAFYPGALGQRVAAGEGRSKSTVGGAASGPLVAGEAGRRMPHPDHGCIAEVLELAPTGQRGRWESAGTRYELRPADPQYLQGSYCRSFNLDVRGRNATQRVVGMACRRPDGIWLAH